LLNIVRFTRVGSVKWSPVIRGDTELIEVGTVSPDEKSRRPGILTG